MLQLIFSVAGLTLAGLVSPGPNFVLITGRALASGQRASIAAAAGVSAGSMTHAIFGIAGFGAVLRSSGPVFTVAKLAGAAYLVWIGIKSLRGAWRARQRRASDERGPLSPMLERPMSARRSLIDGYLTQMSNPKSTLFFLAIFATVVPSEIGISDGVVVVTTISLLALSWYSVVAVLFSRDMFRRRYRRVGHWIDAVFGLLMVGLGVRIALAER